MQDNARQFQGHLRDHIAKAKAAALEQRRTIAQEAKKRKLTAVGAETQGGAAAAPAAAAAAAGSAGTAGVAAPRPAEQAPAQDEAAAYLERKRAEAAAGAPAQGEGGQGPPAPRG
eukprot:2901093-Pyramimonas_sp.AAC.1